MKNQNRPWLQLVRLSGFGLCVALLVMLGCVSPPRSALWRSEEAALQPAGNADGVSGSLVVETSSLGTDNGFERRRPFFVYDQLGRYFTHSQNDRMSPVTLPAGRYVVVTTILMTNRRVQVVVRDGMTTRVRLADFESAPEAL